MKWHGHSSIGFFYRVLPLILLITCVSACDNGDTSAFQGYVEGENIYMASPYSGTLINLAVTRGQSVKKGQLLFRLDPEPEQLRVKQAQSDVDRALHVVNDLKNPRRSPEIDQIKAQIEQVNARISLAQIRVSRNQELYARKAVDKDSLDAAISNLEDQQKLKAQYEASLHLAEMGSREEQIYAQEAELMLLKEKQKDAAWQLAQKTVYAPGDGIIFDTYFLEGEFVAAQQAVLSLLTPGNVRIEFFVPVDTLPQLTIGQKITFLCEGCTKRDEASISYISPEAQYIPPLVYSRDNNQKLVYRIKARLYSFNQYKPGQPVMVYLKEP
ncbi:HlyD family secretion protein [Legionella sp. CNM-4043-24]|uniref:HlyD family secretion protein n=1 Tax=Legionella sp. CNM-4043-24 TaxID=3421646 RepID=UPI00403A9D90